MEGVKGFFQSKTIWGALIALASVAPALLALFGFSITSEDSASFVSGIQTLGATVGALIAIWGRVVASKTIG